MSINSSRESELFLDSSTILGRIFKYELYHNLCLRILSSSLEKFSSKTVYQEIKNVIKRRNDLYNNLQLARAKRAKEKKLKKIIQMDTKNKNDQRFLYELKHRTMEEGGGTHWIQAFKAILGQSLSMQKFNCPNVFKKKSIFH